MPEPEEGHTISGGGPAAQPAAATMMQKMQMQWARAANGTRALVIRFVIRANDDGTEDVMFYVISGDELFKFHQYVKDGMEGRERRPSYLG